jgi:hypothetical protein
MELTDADGGFIDQQGRVTGGACSLQVRCARVCGKLCCICVLSPLPA